MKTMCLPLGRIAGVYCSDANYSNCANCKKTYPACGNQCLLKQQSEIELCPKIRKQAAK